MMHEKLATLTNKYQLNVAESKEQLLIRKNYQLFHLDNLATLLFLALIVFVIYQAWGETNGFLDYLFVFLIFGFVILLLVAIVKDFTDYVMVDANEITVRNNLTKEKIKIESPTKIRIARREEIVTREGRVIKRFWVFELYLKQQKKEIRLLDFSAEPKDTLEADFLANSIKQKIEDKIRLALTEQ